MILNAASAYLGRVDAAFLCVLLTATAYEVHIVCVTNAAYIVQSHRIVGTQTRRVRAR